MRTVLKEVICPCCGTKQLKIPTLVEIESHYLASVLHLTNNNAAQTMRILGISRTTFYRKIKKIRKDIQNGST